MSSLHFLLHSSSDTIENFHDKFRDLAANLSKNGYKTSPVFETLGSALISQCVLSDSHIALLLQDGRVCRTSYSLLTDRLDLSSKVTDAKSNTSSTTAGVSSYTTTSSLAANARLDRLARHEQSTASSLATLASAASAVVTRPVSGTIAVSGAGSSASRGSRASRILHAVTSAGGRPAGVLLGRPPIPSSLVPNELVDQCLSVLQGKSRSLIIRELQRTNLDVNLAVNNLLSRDDEGDEDDDSQDGYMPGDDLMSLLDSGAPGDHSAVLMDAAEALMTDDLLSYHPIRSRVAGRQSQAASSAPAGRAAMANAAADDESLRHDREPSFLRLRERRWLDSALREESSDIRSSVERCFNLMRGGSSEAGSGRKVEPKSSRTSSSCAQPATDKSNSNKSSQQNLHNALSFGEQLQFMTMPESGAIYTKITAMHSELLVLDSQGKLHQWKWTEQEPFTSAESTDVHHPKAIPLLLANEKVVGISSSLVRASVWTESSKVAVWADESLATVGNKLELPATNFPEFDNSSIKCVYTSSLYSCAWLENGALFWWGILPTPLRKKLVERAHQKSKKSKEKDRSASDIVTGQQVCMKSNPLYHAGAVAFNLSGSMPKVGQLMASAWSWSDVCRFQLKKKVTTEAKSDGKDGKVARGADINFDMPPPPSPASSTCSEQSGPVLVSPGSATAKRKRQPTPIKELDKGLCDEEDWNIKDCIIVEDGKAANPVGRVIKIDGSFAAVKFSNTSDPVDDPLHNVRLLRKEDLQVVRGATVSKLPEIFQTNPRKVSFPQGQFLAVSLLDNEFHLVVQDNNTNNVSYVIYDIMSNQFSEPYLIPAYHQTLTNKKCLSLFKHQGCTDSLTTPCDGGVTVLQDGSNTLYPLMSNSTQTFTDPRWFELPPVQSVAAHSESLVTVGEPSSKSKLTMMAVALKGADLIRHILRCDVAAVNNVLTQISQEPNPIKHGSQVQEIVAQLADGGRNILHLCAAMCTPTSNKEADDGVGPPIDPYGASGRPEDVGFREMNPMMRRSVTSAPDSFAWSIIHEMGGVAAGGAAIQPNPGTTMWSMPAVTLSDKERRFNAATILNILCECPMLEPCLRTLLSFRNTDGLTPFMQAVSTRAYNAAMTLYNVAKQNASVSGSIDQEAFMSMLYPAGCNADDNPFLVLCCNDTCSFTWTGTKHINQDIYECKTCGLTGSLCCCSECARVCHKGHNCKLKVTSPTAYCDCWEKCKCKALIAGNQVTRHELLNKLLLETDLAKQPNSRGEDVLLFLVQTVGRQAIEQKQHPHRPRSSVVRKSNAADADPNVPEHDLDPPKFAKKALERILNDWTAVKCMLLNGYTGQQESGGEPVLDDQAYLRNQNGTHLLDKFTHTLLAKCSADMLDTLLTTLIREMQTVSKVKHKQEALLVARRFIRSVVRIFVIRSVENSSETTVRITSSNRNAYVANANTLSKCKQAFQSVVHIAVQELCQAANALILPVTLGVVKPTSAFSLLTSTSLETVQGNEDLFLADPLPQRPAGGESSSHHPHLDNTMQSEIADQSALYDEDELDSMAREQYEPEDGVDVGEGQAGTADREIIPLADPELDIEAADQEPEYPGDQVEGESDMDLDLLAESDSENESVHGGSVHSAGAYDEGAQGSAGRSNAAQIGSAEGMQMAFFSEEDSNSSDEEVDSDDGQDSDQEYDNALDVEQLERRSSEPGAVSQRSHQAPQSMRWALRQPPVPSTSSSRPAASNSSNNPSAAGGLIYLEPTGLRRGNAAAMNNALSAAAAQSAAAAVAAQQATDDPSSSQNVTSTANNLSRAFGVILRQIADLINTIKDYRASAPNLAIVLDYSEKDVQQLQAYVESQLRHPWSWLVGVMDSTEAQLRFGTALVSSTDSSSPHHPMNPSYFRQGEQSTSSRLASTARANLAHSQWSQAHRRQRQIALEAGSGRQGFLSYMLSLMRSHNDEHSGSLPVVDVLALKHVAYVFDAMVYYMKAADEEEPDIVITNDKISIQSWPEPEDEDSKMSVDSCVPEDLATPSSSRHTFFHRSESTTFIGCVSPDPIHTPLQQALPLAEKPQLLHPLARREEMFGISKQRINKSQVTDSKFGELPIHMGLAKHAVGGEPSDSPNLDSMGTYSGEDPPQDEPADLRIPRTEANKPTFSNVLGKPPLVQGAHDPSVLGLVPIVSKPTSVIVSNQTLLTESTIQPSTSMTETLAEQTIKPAGNRTMFFGEAITYESLIGRWRQTAQMFGHIFCDDVGLEPGSIISELGGFPVKETKFRRDMEKIRNAQQRDLSIEVDRDRNQLLAQTIKQLNAQFVKRAHYGGPYSPPLSSHRIKAMFKMEPGEGSGVARSFYTDFARAVTSADKLPVLDPVHTASGKKAAGKQTTARRSSIAESGKLGRFSEAKRVMSANAAPYFLPLAGSTSQDMNSTIPAPRRHLGEKILPRVQVLQPAMAHKITGMLLELAPGQLLTVVANDGALKEKVDEAMTILTAAGEVQPAEGSSPSAGGNSSQPDASSSQQLGGAATSAFSAVTRAKDGNASSQKVEATPEVDLERMPLFHQPGKPGYYSPLLGSGSTTRLNAFRNIGRVLGLCLLQNEICPLYLTRPVIKFILGRPIRWHDLAFHDPALYESLRTLLSDTELKDPTATLTSLDLTFTIDDESTGTTHNLIPGGADVSIGAHNVYCYIRKYAHFKMVKSCEKALEQLKTGVHDVIPRNSLEGLFAEDFRLLLNGQNDINIQTLIGYTSFNDESGETNNEKVQKFKRWFWSIAEKMSPQEREDLVYFWTSSPALPASEEGFQPMPTITIRPADDNHLPTANTCISRLYIPLYSSKQILKTKLILSIKTKAFGFV